MQTLNQQGLKELLQKVIDQKGHVPDVPTSSQISAQTGFKPPSVTHNDESLPTLEIPAPSPVEPETKPVPDVILEPEIAEAASSEPVVMAHIVAPIVEEKATERARESKSTEKEKQITTLKKAVKELGAKNTAQEKALTKQEEVNAKLKSDLEKAKQLVAEFSKRCKEHELALSKIQETEQKHEEEQESHKKAIATLTKSLQQARLEALKREDELSIKVQDASLDNQETKGRLLRLISDKKELEDMVTSLSCEKATLAARLQSLTQKGIKLEEAESLLTQKIQEITQSLETATLELSSTHEELAQERTQAACHKSKNEELLARLEELQEKLVHHSSAAQDAQNKNAELTEQLEAYKTNHSQELAVTRACLQEQGHVLEEEQKKLKFLSQEHIFVQKRAEEQENHLRLLEQHLARRVKECALLSKQIEDLMDRTSQLHSALSASAQKASTLEESLDGAKKVENSLRCELDSQANSYQDALRNKEDELAAAREELERKNHELAQLRRVQNQFCELEELVRRSAQIFSTAELPPTPPEPLPVQLSQKDFFAFSSSPKPQPKSLFE